MEDSSRRKRLPVPHHARSRGRCSGLAGVPLVLPLCTRRRKVAIPRRSRFPARVAFRYSRSTRDPRRIMSAAIRCSSRIVASTSSAALRSIPTRDRPDRSRIPCTCRNGSRRAVRHPQAYHALHQHALQPPDELTSARPRLGMLADAGVPSDARRALARVNDDVA